MIEIREARKQEQLRKENMFYYIICGSILLTLALLIFLEVITKTSQLV
jgi:hypothetical protein